VLGLAAGIAGLGEGPDLARFELAGPGITTTLNAGWEPIVASPETGTRVLLQPADALVINSFLATKEEQLIPSTP
jgi:hypothetical protein